MRDWRRWWHGAPVFVVTRLPAGAAVAVLRRELRRRQKQRAVGHYITGTVSETGRVRLVGTIDRRVSSSWNLVLNGQVLARPEGGSELRAWIGWSPFFRAFAVAWAGFCLTSAAVGLLALTFGDAEPGESPHLVLIVPLIFLAAFAILTTGLSRLADRSAEHVVTWLHDQLGAEDSEGSV